MDFGAHLPLMDFGGHPFTLEHLVHYTQTADRLGFSALAVNDHLMLFAPWLDGPTALAAVMSHSGDMTMATTVALPVVRGPVPLAKSLGAIDRLSGGRLIVAVGPGSAQQDYQAVGIDFEERWARLDEAVQALRALWQSDAEPFTGRFYSTRGITLDPRPARYFHCAKIVLSRPIASSAAFNTSRCCGTSISLAAGGILYFRKSISNESR